MTLYPKFEEDWIDFFYRYRETHKQLGIESFRKLRLSDPIRNDPETIIEYELVREGITGLIFLFKYLLNMYSYAIAAEAVAKKYDISDVKIANTWRIHFRNYHFYDFVPRYFSFLDYSAYFVVSLTRFKLLRKPSKGQIKNIKYLAIIKLLEEKNCDGRIGYLTCEDRNTLLVFLQKIIQNDRETHELYKTYRDRMTHYEFPGIDLMVRLLDPTFTDAEKEKDQIFDGYGVLGDPRYSFNELSDFALSVIRAVDNSLANTLTKVEIIKRYIL